MCLKRVLACLIVVAAVHTASRSVLAQSGPGTPGVASLQQTLQDGLKARTADELAFIQTVVDKVNAGALPLNLVDTTFQWARRKTHPMQYFEFGLRARAKKAGIDL